MCFWSTIDGKLLKKGKGHEGCSYMVVEESGVVASCGDDGVIVWDV